MGKCLRRERIRLETAFDVSIPAFDDYAFDPDGPLAALNAPTYAVAVAGAAVSSVVAPHRIVHDERYFYLEDEPPYDPALLVDGRYDERANAVTAATLQRDVHVRGSSHGGGKGRSRSSVVAPKPIDLRAPDREEDVEEFGVYGLTLGEKTFYRNRRGLAVTVLTDAAKSIEAGERFLDEFMLVRGKRASLNFYVYGLKPLHAFVLKTFPGAARVALAKHARERDGDHIARLDAGWTESTRSAAA